MFVVLVVVAFQKHGNAMATMIVGKEHGMRHIQTVQIQMEDVFVLGNIFINAITASALAELSFVTVKMIVVTALMKTKFIIVEIVHALTKNSIANLMQIYLNQNTNVFQELGFVMEMLHVQEAKMKVKLYVVFQKKNATKANFDVPTNIAFMALGNVMVTMIA